MKAGARYVSVSHVNVTHGFIVITPLYRTYLGCPTPLLPLGLTSTGVHVSLLYSMVIDTVSNEIESFMDGLFRRGSIVVSIHLHA